MYTYLLINLFSVIIPFIYSFHKRLDFYKTWYAFWPAAILTAVFFIIWDVLFTKWGIWGFNPKYLLGVYFLHLPIEEWLFFLCIPYACVFTYACLKLLITKDYIAPYSKAITWSLIIGLTFITVLYWDRLYTSVTFILTGIFLLIHLFVFKSKYLGRFYFAYIIIFIPFCITNGILTGSFIAEEVVWYNNAENLSLRFFTIPVEDTIYGLLLILMNVTFYEMIMVKRKSRNR